MKKIFKRDYICPYCFTKKKLNEVEFRCSNDPKYCEPAQDNKYAQFLGIPTSVKGRIVEAPASNGYAMPRVSTCPNCQQNTSIRVCTECHSELPGTIDEHEDLIFAVIGVKEAGKSHYISVLINKIRNEVGEAYDCSLKACNDETIHRYREEFYNPIFTKREVIPATRSARADVQVKMPLIYTLSFMKKGLFGKKKIAKVVTLVFFDTAGEDLNAEDTMLIENKYIYNSTGIIFLLDPLQLPAVRHSLPSDTPLPNENTNIEDLLSRVSNLIRKANNIKQKDKIKIPTALAFSKIDAIDPILPADSSLKFPSKHIHSGYFNLNDYKDVNGEMEAYVREWSGDSFAKQVESDFNDYAYFGLTSLGDNPHGDMKIKKFRPHRVEDPFLWLLWKNGVIKGK